jgi:hypothetical protein
MAEEGPAGKLRVKCKVCGRRQCLSPRPTNLVYAAAYNTTNQTFANNPIVSFSHLQLPAGGVSHDTTNFTVSTSGLYEISFNCVYCLLSTGDTVVFTLRQITPTETNYAPALTIIANTYTGVTIPASLHFLLLLPAQATLQIHVQETAPGGIILTQASLIIKRLST